MYVSKFGCPPRCLFLYLDVCHDFGELGREIIIIYLTIIKSSVKVTKVSF